MSPWAEGWQLGLVLGTALGLVLQAAAHWLLFRARHRHHVHCDVCAGCLGPDGRGIGAPEHLHLCPACGDTTAVPLGEPAPSWATPAVLAGEPAPAAPAAPAITRALPALPPHVE